ncbi:hypothetical protein BZZ08_04828 [Streptomyces sp. MH60]|nr:hypothetical protein BZZ08_04828 [Streptomyces sp. MH60]
MQLAVGGVVEQGGGRVRRGVETGPEGGVGEPGVGVLEPLGGVLGDPGGVGRLREQRRPSFQLRGPRAHALGAAPGPRQLLLQRRLFALQPLPARDPGGGPDGGLLLGGDALFAFAFGPPQLLLRGVQAGGGRPRPRVRRLQFLGLLGQPGGGRVPGFRRGGGERLPYGAQVPLGPCAPLVGGLVGGEGALLRVAVDVPGGLAGGGGVLGGAAHRARCAVGEVRGEFGGDAVQPLFLEVEPVGAGLDGVFRRGERPPPRLFGVVGEPVPLPGGLQSAPRRVALYGELFRAAGGLLRGVDAALESGAGGLPVGEPGLRLLADLLVGAFLPVEAVPLRDQVGEAPFGAPGRLEAAQFLGGPAGGGGEAGPTAQLITEDGPAEGSVSVTYTPQGGSGSATATVSNACVGTVYWTGLLADSGSGA